MALWGCKDAVDSDIANTTSSFATKAEQRGYQRGLEEAAKVADAFADENIRMAQDTIVIDPILNGAAPTEDNIKLFKRNQIDGCVYSSMYHAAQNVAAAIRALKTT